MKRICASFAIVIAVSLCFAARSAKDKQKEALALELQNLIELVQGSRDSLENEIAARYTFKQHTVEQREADKEEFDRLREQQEKAINELSRVKEECLVREQNLAEAKKIAAEKQEEWKIVKNGVDELMQKEADGLVEVFPIDRERRQSDLEGIRRSFAETKDPLAAWDAFVQYRLNWITGGRGIAVTQARMLPDDGAARSFSLVRFGNVFAYCADSAGAYYMIRQSGRLGAEKFAINRVLLKELNSFLLDAMPKWLQSNRVSGMVMTDVMQNEQSGMLVAGKEQSGFQEFKNQIVAGGWVMVPLLLLPVWALYLVLSKFIQLHMRRNSYRKHLKEAFTLIDKNDSASALAYARSQKGLMPRILEACLDASKLRMPAEHTVRTLIMQEIPYLNRNLNTIAVIAGAAPLLGLLGTISGMITLFAAVTHYGTGDPKFLAGGISEALITAKTGLAIAIPALFLHDILRNMKENTVSEIEAMAEAVLDKTHTQE